MVCVIPAPAPVVNIGQRLWSYDRMELYKFDYYYYYYYWRPSKVL